MYIPPDLYQSHSGHGHLIPTIHQHVERHVLRHLDDHIEQRDRSTSL
jgi:hypothetical protein